MIEVRVLGPQDARVLDRVAADVFDGPVDPALAEAFLADPRHHLVVALEDGVVIGMASAVSYVHPDKPAQLWINEVGVTPTRLGQGIGTQLLRTLLAHGRALGCTLAWVGTEHDNAAARALYVATGGRAEPFVLYEYDLKSPATCGTDLAAAATTPVAVVHEFWRLMASNDFAAVAAVLADDFVLDWPQSRERIRGAERFARMNSEYPAHGPWRFSINRIVGGDPEVVSDVDVTDGVQSGRAISFFTVASGKISRIVEFWPEPFPARPDRAHLVEVMHELELRFAQDS